MRQTQRTHHQPHPFLCLGVHEAACRKTRYYIKPMFAVEISTDICTGIAFVSWEMANLRAQRFSAALCTCPAQMAVSRTPLPLALPSCSGPREDATRIGSAGVVRRQAVDISPLRRVNQVSQGARSTHCLCPDSVQRI